jgi:hypothetical protein
MYNPFSKKNKEIDSLRHEVADIKLALEQAKANQRSLESAVKQKRKTLSKPLAYSTAHSGGLGRGGNNIYHGSLYDLGEIARAMDVEPYVNQSVRKHREQILKEGYQIVGPDEKMVDYILKRLFEMQLVSDITLDDIIRDYSSNLIAYATSFLVLKRVKDNRSSGKPVKIHGKILDPIAAIYPMDPTSVEVKVNKHGHPVTWKQHIDNSISGADTKLFNNSDIVYGTIDRKPGFIFGTPYILPTLDDVRTLRRLEELIEVMANKYAFPGIHWRVGSKDDPPEVLENGASEIDMVKIEVENMANTGGMVTSHRVEHQVIGEGRETLDLHPYVEYFESRVLGGLRLSKIDLGRGDVSKASAQSVSSSLQDSSKDFQSIISSTITNQLFLPLLLEGGFDVKHDNLVKLTFPAINREEERANQQHGQDMYNSGSITRSELRSEFLDRRELKDEQKPDLKQEDDHEKAKDLAKLAASLKPAPASSSSSSGPAPNKANKTKKAANSTVQNKVRPANQSGKKASKTKITANNHYEASKILYRDFVSTQITDLKELLSSFINKHGAGVSSSGDIHDVTTKQKELEMIFDSFVTILLAENRTFIETIIQDGVEDSLLQMGILTRYNIPKKTIDRFFKNYVLKSLNKLCTQTQDDFYSNETLASEQDSFKLKCAMFSITDQMTDELDILCDQHIDYSYRFGFVRGCKAHNCTSVQLKATPESIEDGAEDITISLASKDIPYSQLLKTPEKYRYTPYLHN